MKVFLSWSGEQSKAYASALRDWLPLVVHFVEPWVSDADIEAGERWATEVGKELETSNFGVLFITRENIGSQWLLFEAGALSRSMQEGRVIPLLFDIEFKDISGPLAQFQAKKFDSRGVWDAVCAINRLGEQPVPDARLKQLFDALWADLEKQVEAIPTNVKTAKTTRPQSEVLEELVSSVRVLDTRLREVADPDGPNRRRSRVARSVQRDLMSMLDIERGNPVRLLMLASAVRDELPWLYELVSEISRLELSGQKERAFRTKRQLLEAMHMIPVHRMYDEHTIFEIMRELDYWISSDDGLADGQRRVRASPAARTKSQDSDNDSSSKE